MSRASYRQPGRPAKPTALKLLHGNPGKRKLNDREPKPEQVEPPRPSMLSDAAAPHWERLVSMLMAMKVLTAADGLALAIVCNDITELEKLNAAIEKTGYLIKNEISGAVKLNPLLSQQSELNRRVQAGISNFGLTPTSRSRLKSNGPDKAEHDEFDLDA